jgi:hypothetical protein
MTISRAKKYWEKCVLITLKNIFDHQTRVDTNEAQERIVLGLKYKRSSKRDTFEHQRTRDDKATFLPKIFLRNNYTTVIRLVWATNICSPYQPYYSRIVIS